MEPNPYEWHVSSVLRGMGQNRNDFVHYVQRYLNPEMSRSRYNGEILMMTFETLEEAEDVALRLTEGKEIPYSSRMTYL